jgi:hypothetical protein
MMMLIFLYISLFCFQDALAALHLRSGAGAAVDPDMSTIETRLIQSYVTTSNISGMDADVRGYLPLIVPPGIFSDINYTTGMSTGWGGYDHCLRFSEMGSALYTPTSAFYNSAALHTALLDAHTGVFSWFLSAQPHDDANWWYQAIGCARPTSQLSLQLQSSLSAEGIANATILMDRSQWERFSSTGTNAADIALVHIANGLLNGNKTMVAEAFAKMWSTVEYADSEPPSSPEGPKTDGSFMQHGAQLYLGNYGASWTRDVLSNIAIAVNTTFNASTASLATAAHVVLDGCARVIHWPSAQWDVAVIGRQITNPGGQAVVGQPNGDAGLLDPKVLRAAAAGPRAAELLALAAALENPASVRMPVRFSAFYASDYAVQTQPSYYASVRMISSRTAGGECINGQGLQALHAADGVQYIMTSGHEYDNIAPTWDWEMLPGTTVQRGGAPLSCKTSDGMGSGTMTGVHTRDNTTGIAWMDLNNTRYGQNLRARKAYFFFDGVLINLGAAIEAPSSFRVTTTMDSRLLAGTVSVSRDGGASFTTQPTGNATIQLSAPSPKGIPRLLVAHSGMGFAELGDAGAVGATTPTSAQLLNAPVSGNWSSVGTHPGIITNNMFTLSLDHGIDTAGGGAAYAYAIWPAVTATDFTGGAWRGALSRYMILSNTLAVTSIFDTINSTLYAVAWDGGAASRVTLPSAIRGGYIDAPFPAGLIVSTYDNSTSGATVLSIAYVEPGSLITGSHDYRYYFNTGAQFVSCSWPDCPGAVNAPKGYVGPPVIKWSCFTNGTILLDSPPSQASMPDSMLFPPVNCALA